MTTHRGAAPASAIMLAGALVLAACRSSPPTSADGGSPAPVEIAGLAVGAAHLADIEAWIAARGLRCDDVSMKHLMDRAAATASGSADAISGASRQTDTGADPRPARPTSPQVRLGCRDVPAALLGAGHPEITGRLLLVLDDDDAPLRNLSHQRQHLDRAAALADLAATIATLSARFGAPTEVRADAATLERLVPVVRRWRAGEIEIRLSALDHGARGVAISEEIGVPYPAHGL